ncbi:PD-(D/E)XK nuclease-like domain-containing protein [Intestinibacillus massiliensis]|nr:PD-(D/E)XK nuclease-like domain-containing protein [Intestinibacillus massiliensis]
MTLTDANYYSHEANQEYMSVSQFKSFLKCEAAAMAELSGEYVRPKTTALLVGSYVDAWFEGTLDSFKQSNPEIYKQNGTLKSDYIHAERIIERVSRDMVFMDYMSGEKQRIFTGNLFGAPWKIKVDSWFADKLVDLKVMRTLEPIMGKPFIEHWGYDLQGAVYQTVEGGNKPFFIAAVTKEDPADLAVISIPQCVLEDALEYIRFRMPHILAVKHGAIEPERCGVCPYCRATKVLTGTVNMEDVGYSTKQLKQMRGEA